METKFAKQEWLREKTTVYSLHQIGWKKGEPIMSNKFYFQVYPDYRLEDAEQEAIKIAKRMAAADDMLNACLTAKAMYEAQGITTDSIIGGEQYSELLLAIKKATE